jgi:hypothetical protein
MAAHQIGVTGEFEPAPLGRVGRLDGEALALRRRHRLEAGDLGRNPGGAGAQRQQGGGSRKGEKFL